MNRWRVALIDSGCDPPAPVPLGAVRLHLVGGTIREDAVVADPSGHGSRMARIIAAAASAPELLLAQVFDDERATSAAAVAAGVRWALRQGAQLLHMSLGLGADREVLRAAIAEAIAAGRIVVTAAPARGTLPYPAAYPGVLRASGDARCSAMQISALDPAALLFGGCVRTEGVAGGAGASIGAAHVTRALLDLAPHPGCTLAEAGAALEQAATFKGREQRR
jgi:subtilisin family serine protease